MIRRERTGQHHGTIGYAKPRQHGRTPHARKLRPAGERRDKLARTHGRRFAARTRCAGHPSYQNRGSTPISAARYTSEHFARLERERMWPRVWQFAAREEDLPDPGDYVVYENAGRSFLISRQDDGSVRAMHNVCLHRGRKLRTEDGSADRFVCPFHGFAWNKDGSFNHMPCKWDFQHLDEAKLSLPPVEVGRWGGYIFLREEPGGPSLEEFLAPLPDHFKRWRHEECVTVMWVGKEVPANWKVTAEAFMEAWHTVVTHPQLLPFTGDCNSAYWTWGDHVNVNLVPFGTMSPRSYRQERAVDRRPVREIQRPQR
jgi:phenylpropionate dioxygenase-like ring-hydroxylating dioxygenase large terminal subunit